MSLHDLHDLMRELRQLNVRLWVEDGNLRFSAPNNALSADVRQRMVERKVDLVRALEQAVVQDGDAVAATADAGRGDGLSFAQQRLLFLHRMDSTSCAYNLPLAWRIRGHLDAAALQRSFARLPQLHDALRVGFHLEGGEFVTRVAPAMPLVLATASLTHCPEAEREAALARLVDEESLRLFDLDRAPLLRGTLIELAQDDHALLLTMHHVVSDGWSMDLLARDLWNLYANGGQIDPSTLAERSARPGYRHYVGWQSRWEQSDAFLRQKRYWVEQLAGLPELIDLPVDHPRPAVQRYEGEVEYFELPVHLVERLAEVAQARGASVYMALLGVFAVLLHRYTAQADIAIGTPMANRREQQWEDVLGFFSNVVVLRLMANREATFLELLEHVRDTALCAYDHQEFPFEQVVEHLQPQRSLSHSPLFQVMFTLREANAAAAAPGLRAETLPAHNRVAKFDLTLAVERGSERVVAGLEYRTALFKPATMRRMAAHFVRLLEQIAADPGRRIGDLQLVAPEEHAAQALWNATDAPFDEQSCIHQLIEAQARQTPEAIAVSFEDVDVSYAELLGRSRLLANALRGRGIGAECRVGIFIDRSPDLVVALLGVLQAGAAYVPLDPKYPPARIGGIVADADLACIVAAGPARQHVPAGTAVPVLALEECLALAADQEVDAGVCSDNAAYVIYTSGSTGHPKGVVVSHRNVMNLFEGLDRSLAPALPPQAGTGRPVWTALTSISFDISVLELLWTLARGHQVLLQTDHLTALAVSGALARQSPQRSNLSGPGSTVRAKPLEFSLFYFASDEDAGGDKYRLLLEGARFADSHGFCAVWVPERHFHAFGGSFPNPSVAAAAVSVLTSNIQVRAGSVVLPLHNPIRVAEEWSMVDNLSGGRAAIAFASGWHFNDFVLAPQNFADRHRVMRDGIETVKRLWAGETIAQTDGLGNEAQIGVRPRPIQAELPIWLTAAASPDTFRYAGEIGANVLTHLLGQSLTELREKIDIYRKARADNGHDADAGCVTLMMHTHLGEDLEEVRERVREPFKNYLRTSINLLKAVADSDGLDVGTDLEMVVEAGFKRYFAAGALFGTPDSCQSLLSDVHSIGVDEIACLVDFGVDGDQVIDSFVHVDAMRRRAIAPRQNEADAAGRTSIGAEATHIQCTPSFAKLLLEQKHAPALSNIQGFLVGGEALSPALSRELRSATGGHVFNMYGPTETTVWSAVRHIQEDEVVIGPPISNTRLHVLDEGLNLLPVGISGELHIAGEGVTRGYWNLPDMTAERFIPDPFATRPGSRMYRTGDRVRRLDDGSLEFLGRIDHQVKVRGFRVELGDVEAALRSHPAAGEVIAVVRGVEQHEAMIVAYVTASDGASVDTGELLQHAARHLPSHMLPSVIVALESLPLTPNGKVDRKALPAPGEVRGRQPRELPRSELEQALSDVWCELLQLDSVGVNENFFELGGHSLLLGRLQQSLATKFGCEISIIELFKFPTIDSLTRLIGQRDGTNAPSASGSQRVRDGQQAVQQMRQRMKQRKFNG
ncbi:MAG: LLM class flavin-dependent oxidoreductase [Pseudomonadota bacterium]|nr:LLM class flavin-dependent oxidoreductase [Pseudomonadota bacterium]